MVLINKVSTSTVRRLSALATGTAAFYDQTAAFLGQEFENSQGFRNRLPSHQISNQPDLVGETRRYLPTALTSITSSFHFRLLIPGMTVKDSGWRKFAQFMAYHILSDENGNNFLAL